MSHFPQIFRTFHPPLQLYNFNLLVKIKISKTHNSINSENKPPIEKKIFLCYAKFSQKAHFPKFPELFIPFFNFFDLICQYQVLKCPLSKGSEKADKNICTPLHPTPNQNSKDNIQNTLINVRTRLNTKIRMISKIF